MGNIKRKSADILADFIECDRPIIYLETFDFDRADEIITGSFVNAKAVSEYIRKRNPGKVSLVCMGKEGLAPAEEDELCAVYLKNLLTAGEMPGIDPALWNLRFGGGRHFFDPSLREVFPEQDFWMCIARDRFGFVLRIGKDAEGYVSEKIPV